MLLDSVFKHLLRFLFFFCGIFLVAKALILIFHRRQRKLFLVEEFYPPHKYMPLSFCYMDLSIFLEYVDFSVHVYKFIALPTVALRQGNLFHKVHLFVSQKEVVLQSNSSQSALPVALGAGCDHRILSSLDVCRQVM